MPRSGRLCQLGMTLRWAVAASVSAETLVTKPLLNVTAVAVTVLASVTGWLLRELTHSYRGQHMHLVGRDWNALLIGAPRRQQTSA